MAGSQTALGTTQKQTKFKEWMNAVWKNLKNSSELSQSCITTKFSLLVVSIKISMFTASKLKSGFCLRNGMLTGDYRKYIILYIFSKKSKKT